eukprot:m.24805 g.24805  ORF g.24805 m.24805 type:complete len:84 (-) comp13111_c0_seq1:522-773(-)
MMLPEHSMVDTHTASKSRCTPDAKSHSLLPLVNQNRSKSGVDKSVASSWALLYMKLILELVWNCGQLGDMSLIDQDEHHQNCF